MSRVVIARVFIVRPFVRREFIIVSTSLLLLEIQLLVFLHTHLL